MRDYYEFDLTPFEEDCAQVGQSTYYQDALAEYKAIKGQLERLAGPLPEGTRFKLLACPHDFGTYHELQFVFDPEKQVHIDYINKLEEIWPARWDEEAKVSLRKHNYSKFLRD